MSRYDVDMKHKSQKYIFVTHFRVNYRYQIAVIHMWKVIIMNKCLLIQKY